MRRCPSESINLLTEIDGEKSLFAPLIYFSLAYCRIYQGRFDEAEELMLKCVQLLAMTLGESHIMIVCCYILLAHIYTMQDRSSDAEAMLKLAQILMVKVECSQLYLILHRP